MTDLTALTPDDIPGHYAALRALIRNRRKVDLIPRPEVRSRYASMAETVFGKTLGTDTACFLDMLADIEGSGAFSEMFGDAGKAVASDPSPYAPGLENLQTIDPNVAGLGLFRCIGTDIFSILSDDQRSTYPPLHVHGVETHDGQRTLSRRMTHHHLIALALRLWASPMGPYRAGLGAECDDPEAFYSCATEALGMPADFGDGLLLWLSDTAQILVQPVGFVTVWIDVFDARHGVDLPDALLALCDATAYDLRPALTQD